MNQIIILVDFVFNPTIKEIKLSINIFIIFTWKTEKNIFCQNKHWKSQSIAFVFYIMAVIMKSFLHYNSY